MGHCGGNNTTSTATHKTRTAAMTRGELTVSRSACKRALPSGTTLSSVVSPKPAGTEMSASLRPNLFGRKACDATGLQNETFRSKCALGREIVLEL